MQIRNLKAFNALIEKAKSTTRREVIEAYSAVLVLVLKDKFEFTPEQLKEVVMEINHQFDCMADELFHPTEILETLREEGVDIELK